jgi:hypothetical protein
MNNHHAEQTQVQFRDVPPPFGDNHPFGCCTAIVGRTVCGWPRSEDGTCGDGHPAEPGWTPPFDEGDGA